MLILKKKAKIIVACVIFCALVIAGTLVERLERDAFVMETVATEDALPYQAEGDGVIDGKININSANAEELTRLDGIGPALSARIIRYREENGAFDTIEGIMRVSGISEKKFAVIKDNICAD